jgi:hypothetical protein
MVLAGPRVLVVGVMTRRTATARQNAAAGQQSALFGDPTPRPEPADRPPRRGVWSGSNGSSRAHSASVRS